VCLLWTRKTGAGELWGANETGRDALATLVQARTAAPLRAIYIQAKSSSAAAQARALAGIL
jgi:hypothetical protein